MKVSPSIQNLVPYQPGKPISEVQREYGLSRVIKLASNENPLGVSPKVKAAMEQAMAEIHRYPDPGCFELRQALASYWKVPADQIAIGNGSNELIDLLVRIFCEPGEAILTSQSAFVAYAVCAQAARVRVLKTPLTPSFGMDLGAMAKVLREHPAKEDVRLVFLPNPNNPTGTYIKRSDLEEFLQEFGKDPDRLMVVMDEAYTEFVTAKDCPNALELRSRFPALLVLRTLSKVYGLAGLRLGALVAPVGVLDFIHRVRNPFNVNSLAQAAAIAALKDLDFLNSVVLLNTQELQKSYIELEKLGLSVVPSQANFVLFDTHRDAMRVFEELLRRGVILRPVGNYGLPRHLRMSMGLPEENAEAYRVLAEVLPTIPKNP